MGLRDNLRAFSERWAQEQRGITAQDFASGADLDDWFSTASGENVTTDSVLGIMHAWACVSLIVNDVRKLPVSAYRRLPDGRREELPRPSWMRRPDPNDLNTTFRDHVGQAVMSLLVDGNAFIFAAPSVFNVETVFAMDPAGVDIRGRRFVVKATGDEYTERNVRHIRGLTKPGARRGMNPIQAAREGFGLTLAAEQFGQRFFENGAVMSGIIETPAGAVVDAEEIAKQFKRKHDAKRKSHAVGVLTGGASFRQLSFSPEDTQFMALRKYQLEDTARLFHVPPFKIGSTEPGAVAYASTTNARVDYVESAISPIVSVLEDAYSDLVPGDDTYVRFDLNGLLRGDMGARFTAYHTLLGDRVITRDEVRAWEDWNPADEAKGVNTANGGYLDTPNNTATTPQQ